MGKQEKDKQFGNLPGCAVEFIRLVIKKMRYRKSVRQDVQHELTVHFEDELKGCASDKEKEQKARQLISEFGDVNLLAVLLRRAKKRCRPIWQTVATRTFQVAAILLVSLVLYVIWFLTGRPIITTNYLDELNRIVRPAADESLNAAPLYTKAAELYVKEPNEIHKFIVGKYKEISPEQKQLINNWISENEQALQLVADASKKPYCWREYKTHRDTCDTTQMIAVLIPDLQNFRGLARALSWRAQLRAEQGRYEDAFNDLKACYQFGQHIRGDKSLIEQLVGIAIEAIAVQTIRDVIGRYHIDSATLATLQQDFEQMIANEDFTVSIRFEKLSIYDEIQRVFTGGLGGSHIIPKCIVELEPAVQVIGLSGGNEGASFTKKQGQSWLSKLISGVRYEICELGGFIYEAGRFIKKTGYILFLHPNKQQTKESVDRVYSYWDRISRKSPAQIQTEGIDVEKESMEIVRGNILLEIFTPALGRIIELSHRIRVDVEATLAVIAILRYKQDTGDYPAKLDELVTAGYLKELPMDPYTDKPLIYKKTDGNFTLYSIGSNFKDDGGESGKDSKGRPTKWRDNGDTVFWPVPEFSQEPKGEVGVISLGK